MKKLILLAALMMGMTAAQNYDSPSYFYAGRIAAFTSGLVLLECPRVEHPEYAENVTCVETTEAARDIRSGADTAMMRHVESDPSFEPTGWHEMEAGYLMRAFPVREGALRVEIHDAGEARMIQVYALD